MSAQYFHRLDDALRGLAIDPETAGDPIKRTFLFDGQDLSCNVNILGESVDVLHIRPTMTRSSWSCGVSADFASAAKQGAAKPET